MVFDEIGHQIGVILGDVVQAVRDRAADIILGVVDQGLQDRQDRCGVRDELGQAHGPGKAGAGAFTRKAADVVVRVEHPVRDIASAASCSSAMKGRMPILR